MVGGAVMTLIAPTLQAFFTDRLIQQRQASPQTIAAYRDTLRLLLTFVHQRTGKTPAQLDWDDLDATTISAFLNHLESERRNSTRTRNVRLTAIRSLFSYAALRHPEHAAAHPARAGHPPETVRQADRDIPDRHRNRRAARRAGSGPLGRPARPGPDAAGRPDRPSGLRTHQPELRRRHTRSRRQRPLRRQRTKAARRPSHQPRPGAAAAPGSRERAGHPDDPLFPTRTGRRLSRDAVALRVSTHAATAAQRCPSLLGKRIHPHVLRHSCAMSLLQAGVDTSVIALWLGHAGVRSTDAYVHADISIKERALALTTPAAAKPGRYHPTDKTLAFLEGL